MKSLTIFFRWNWKFQFKLTSLTDTLMCKYDNWATNRKINIIIKKVNINPSELNLIPEEELMPIWWYKFLLISIESLDAVHTCSMLTQQHEVGLKFPRTLEIAECLSKSDTFDASCIALLSPTWCQQILSENLSGLEVACRTDFQSLKVPHTTEIHLKCTAITWRFNASSPTQVIITHHHDAVRWRWSTLTSNK